ncbi:MAG TPA: DUF5988 family protein [Streptosporangiaceae bacterium]|jgi:hypothetical protein
MEDPVISIVEAVSVQAILEGGPATIPVTSRLLQVSALDEKVKLLHYGGYEHFERAGGLVGDTARGQVVYRWTMRTELAE